MNRHGGPRRGAGRPRKWHFEDVLKVGQTCEVKWREASDQAVATRRAALPHADLIRGLQDGAKAIPVPKRKEWTDSEAYEDHSRDIESWLHARARTPFSEETGDYEGSAPRIASVSRKPPRGTRKRIIAEIALQFGLPESTVDNLWQEYRRFEREPQDSDET